ncbi:hypothetical protein PHISCL_02804 [Aspergillus sclerotialis]|uniref:Vacuolar ATPase assembly protein VMA22 n=1 Tax=Aspergillus sclerotialis TaxID=2070753 RepID=A0A3A2ZQ64_9EURO|nr:hypothetical protein PHISCL_02804 [Aspergillus sclerotialis]
MSRFPTPPASRYSSESLNDTYEKTPVVDSSAELSRYLDALLERYLGLLDRHQTLQSDLAKQLSSGFLSLAHANYTCPPGRRYGTDYYDERMKACRRISLQTSVSSDAIANPKSEPEKTASLDNYRYNFSIKSIAGECHQTDDNEENRKSKSDTSSTKSGQLLTEGKMDTSTTAAESSDFSEHSNEESTDLEGPSITQKKKKFRSLDPITWYGILVPASLRSAQKSFTEAVESQLPELACVTVEMRALEKEVERVRQELGGK